MAFQSFVADIVAAPVVLGYGHFTDRFGPHSLPLLPVGDKVQIGAFLESSDPVGSPTISVEVKQSGTTLTLNALAPGHPLYEGDYLFYNFIDFDPGLTGAWEIIPTDSTGTGPSMSTNTIAQPEFLPLVDNVMVQGAPLGARVAWTLPSLDGFDVDGVNIRIIEAKSGHHVWQSDILPLQTTSFEAPAGKMQIGVEYVYWVNLVDIDGPTIENSSKAFSEPFRFTIAGDFNTDGTIDASDIDDLTSQTAGGTHRAPYDLNADALVDDGDIEVWVGDLFHSWIGDANLDGEFNSSDLVTVLATGTYEVDVDSVWSTGDFNGDGRTNSSDLVAALADGGYETGPRPAVASVPKPASFLVLTLSWIGYTIRRRDVGP